MYFDYIIVGASAAGITAARMLRFLDNEASTAMIHAGDDVIYNTCFLSDVIQNPAISERAKMYSFERAQEDKIAFISDTRITTIIPEEHKLITQIGDIFSYRKALLAMGTQSKIPIISQMPEDFDIFSFPGVFSFHSWSDGMAINSYIAQNNVKHALIIGGGINGIECASALHARGLNVTIVEQQTLVTQVSVPPEIINHIKARSIVYEYSEILSISYHSNNALMVILSNGVIVQVELVIIAIGITSSFGAMNIDSNYLHTRGIKIDTYGRVTSDNLYAAGDCAVIIDEHAIIEPCYRWSQAIKEGAAVAENMLATSSNKNNLITLRVRRPIRSTFFGLPVILPVF